jgi:hypothetical protein
MDIDLIRESLYKLEHSVCEARIKKGNRIRVDNGTIITAYDDGGVKFSGRNSEILQRILTVVDKVSG